MKRAYDLAIVGGGAIGLSIAWRSALGGLSVLVADDEPGRGASWAAAGMLAPVTEVHPGEEDLLRLNLASADRWPSWAEELEAASGLAVGFRQTGTLLVARDADDNAALGEVFALQKRFGLTTERLRSRECRKLEPALAPSVRGGIFVSGDHEVDNRALVAALVAACEASGVAFTRDRVDEVSGDRLADGIVLCGGERIRADRVVVAAGPWSNQIEGLARGVLPPVRPVKGQLLHLRARRHSRGPSHVVRGIDFYAVPRGDGRVVVGATVEEQGFDRTVTVGGVHALLRDAVEVVPDLAEMELTEVTSGLRPATPDNAPALGATSIPGLFAATGHFRNGILLTPITSDLMAELLSSDRAPAQLTPFSPRRFEGERVAS
ncbi:MAG: glycine oxidase ThiO [Actinomycetota bacterium]|nr:glycine oxidase ThiO [Actinomycetota bacterium]